MTYREQERENEALANKDVTVSKKEDKLRGKRVGLLLISRPECSNLRGRLR